VDLMHTLRALQRRWYVALPLIMLTILAALFVRGGVQPGYTVTASAVVLPPSSGADPNSTAPSANPLVNLGIATQAKALSILANGPDFRERVSEGESLAAYTVTPQARDPFLSISVESKDDELALNVGQRVVSELQAELERQQPGVPVDQRVTLAPLVEPSLTAVDDSRLRGLVVALAVGLLISVALTIMVDGLVNVRARHGTPGRGGAADPRAEGDDVLSRDLASSSVARDMDSSTTTGPGADRASVGEENARISESTRT
jgi:capsular polysaccharide biosynthesis protein